MTDATRNTHNLTTTPATDATQPLCTTVTAIASVNRPLEQTDNPHPTTTTSFFFLNNPAPTEISPLPLHDALPTSHVAECARAETPPAAPFERMIRRMIRPHRRRADPQVPVNVFGDGRRVGGAFDALRPDWAVRPGVHFAYRADHVGLNPFDGGAERIAGVAAVAHLRGDLVFARGAGELARFVEVVRERLLAVNMLAELDGGHRGDGVVVVGNGHHHSVNVPLLKHFSEVAGLLRAGMR